MATTYLFQAERLQKLAVYLRDLQSELDKLPAEEMERQFNMTAWADTCGAASCAMGHACQIPEFRAAGLKLLQNHPRGTFWCPSFEDSGGFSAAEAFFGLTEDEAYFLFDADSYLEYRDDDRWIQPYQVAQRIEELVQKHQQEAACPPS